MRGFPAWGGAPPLLRESIMDIKAVNSRSLDSCGYDPQNQTLLVVFKSGRRYLYSDVPESEYRELMAASSHGSYFNANVRDRHAFTELKPGESPSPALTKPLKADIRGLLVFGFRPDVKAPALFA